ncbi:hypothetical protein [Kiloniella sp.]|uniref:hypothetical protein n=1 Tax=Kiloniella sp. TaxID=1938587 RepID=UPI003B01E0CA
MLIVIYLLYVKLSETIHINRLLGGRHLFLLNKAEKSQDFYHQKGELVKRGLFVVSSRDENLHKIVNGSADGPGLLYCQVCLRNGLEVKWPVSGRTSDLTSIVDALEGL